MNDSGLALTAGCKNHDGTLAPAALDNSWRYAAVLPPSPRSGTRSTLSRDPGLCVTAVCTAWGCSGCVARAASVT